MLPTGNFSVKLSSDFISKKGECYLEILYENNKVTTRL